MEHEKKKTVVIAEIQPVVAEGVRSLIGGTGDMEIVGTANSLAAALEAVRREQPTLLILDKGFGSQGVLGLLTEMKAAGYTPSVMVWGASITEAEALRLVQAGAKGIIRKSAGLMELMGCIRTAAAGVAWVERELFRGQAPAEADAKPALTPRERQIVELVAQGLKNREIGLELGIRPGTVKVHLKHIFEKTGIRGRYGLALSGLESKTHGVGI